MLTPIISPDAVKYYRHTNIPSGDLRISIVAACNMRCHYCHNEGQGEFRGKFLSSDAVLSIIERSLPYGVRKVRLTGGEPLLHPQILSICRAIKQHFPNVDLGINTNATLVDRLYALVTEGLVSQVVVGLDYFDRVVSKASPSGVASNIILSYVETLKSLNANVQIACVYNEDFDNACKLTEWCLSRKILLKFLEVSDSSVAAETSESFVDLRQGLAQRFSLRLGLTADTSEVFGVSPSGGRVLFFHSHCRVRQCRECAQLHLRVTADGYAKPCLLRTDTMFPLLQGDFSLNMRRAIHNLGVPPENPIV